MAGFQAGVLWSVAHEGSCMAIVWAWGHVTLSPDSGYEELYSVLSLFWNFP